MKKIFALFMCFTIAFGMINHSPISGLQQETISDMDSKIAGDPFGWCINNGTPYDTYQNYSVSNGQLNIANTNTSILEQVTTMYGREAVSENTIRITAKMQNLSQWNAFLIRSQGLINETPSLSNKYFITINANKGVVLYRVNGGLVDLFSGTISNPGFDYEVENLYEIYTENTAGGVIINFKVNGTQILSYEDTSALRITSNGFFGFSAYNNTSDNTLGKYVLPIADMDSTIANDPEGWNITQTPPYDTVQKFSSLNGQISIKNTDTSILEHVTTMYGRSIVAQNTITVTAAMTDLTTTWNSFLVRSEGYVNESPFLSKKYFITLSPNKTTVLYRNNGGFMGIASGTITNPGFDYAAANKYEITTTNTASSVIITFKVNGMQVFSFDDTNPLRITENGYFGFCAYGNQSSNTLGNFFAPANVDSDMDIFILNNPKGWSVNESSPYKENQTFSILNGFMTIQNTDKTVLDQVTTMYGEEKIADNTIRITAKMQNFISKWNAFIVRSEGYINETATLSKKYIIALKPDKTVILYRNNNGFVDIANGTILENGFEYKNENIYEIYTENTLNSIIISFKVNDMLILKVEDTSESRIAGKGYFGFTAYSNNSKNTFGKPNPLRFGINNDEFPIIASCPADWNYFNESNYSDIADANFNGILGLDEIYGGMAMIKSSLDYAHTYGLKMWVNDPVFRQMNDVTKSAIPNYVSPYNDKPAFIGNIFFDEPDKTLMDQSKTSAREYEKITANKVPWYNLLPNYAETTALGFTNWTEYLDYYLRNFKPRYISYDHYPLQHETDTDFMVSNFINGITTISDKARQYKVPLWSYIQSTSFNGGRDLTATDLKWQMYLNLAFGVKAISYWSYATGYEYDQTYHSLIAADGTKTPLYYSAKDLNAEIKTFGNSLLDLDYKGTMVNARAVAKNQISAQLLTSFGPVQSISGGDYIVGCLEDPDGYKKLMVVNWSIQNTSNVSIQLQQGSLNSYDFWRNGIKTNMAVSTDDKITFTLAAGEGVYIDLGDTNLDKKIISDVDNWVSGNVWHPTTITKTNGTIAAAPSTSVNTTDKANVSTQIVYNKKFTNETMIVTAKVENQASWHAIVLRSQNLTGGIFQGTKYFIYFAGVNAYLGRMINNAFTDLGGVSLGGNVDFSLATTYTVSAVNKTDRVLFTIKINGLPEVTLQDATAERLLGEGFFGMGLNEGSPDATLTLGKEILQTPSMNSLVYNISSENIITNVNPETLLTEFNEQSSNNGENLIFKDSFADLIDFNTPNIFVGTGTTVRVETGEFFKTYKMIIFGDVDGDGRISILDLAKVKTHLLHITALSNEFITAGDVNKSNNIGISDLLAVKKQIMGLVNINQN